MFLAAVVFATCQASINLDDIASAMGGDKGWQAPASAWAASPHIDSVDFKKKSVREWLKARPVGAPPVVIRNGLKELEPLLRLSKPKNLKKELVKHSWAQRGVTIDAQGREEEGFVMPMGVKVPPRHSIQTQTHKTSRSSA
jgi:hypothetical protein